LPKSRNIITEIFRKLSDFVKSDAICFDQKLKSNRNIKVVSISLFVSKLKTLHILLLFVL